MSIHAPAPLPQKPGGHFIAFLILTAISVAILLTGLVLGTESRLVFERSGELEFRVTGSNHFTGRQFFSKTITGVSGVTEGDATRAGRRDSVEETQRRRRQRHLEFFGSDGARLGWDRTQDYREIDEFMRGKEPRMALANPPPGWRMALAWFCLGLGALSFIGAIQSSFFPRKNTAPTKA